jgi:excinuclease ABC subunit B
MDRRRKVQERYNKEHNITPTTIVKAVHDVMQEVYPKDEEKIEYKVAQELAKYFKGNKPQKISKEIRKLEKKMYEHAQNLEFEKAAKIRDQIHQIQRFLDI